LIIKACPRKYLKELAKREMPFISWLICLLLSFIIGFSVLTVVSIYTISEVMTGCLPQRAFLDTEIKTPIGFDLSFPRLVTVHPGKGNLSPFKGFIMPVREHFVMAQYHQPVLVVFDHDIDMT